MIIRERAGDTLTGAIDGANTVFQTTLDFSVDYIYVYRNGLLLNPSRDNGFTVSPPRGVVMKEPPLTGDTIEVEYKLDGQPTGGGAEGGVPDAPTVTVLDPRIYLEGEDVPVIQAGEDVPATSSRELRPGILSDDYRPVIVPIDEDGGCQCP